MAKHCIQRRFLFCFLVVASIVLILPRELHAQTCDLNAPGATPVAAATVTRFVPNGSEGQIIVGKKAAESAIVRVFETNGLSPASWKVVAEPTVISVRAGIEKIYEGFSPTESTLVRFVVPPRDDAFWDRRIFVVRFCDKNPGGDVLAIVPTRASSPRLAKIISTAVILLFYVLFALAVSHARSQPHPLAAKYPAVNVQRPLGWLSHLDPVILTANAFNRGSIQKLQVLLFSLLVSGMVLSLVLTLGVLSDLSATVAMLLGISAVGAAVAQKTTSTRDRLGFENWAWLVKRNILPISQEQKNEPKWSDLVVTNREFDVYKLQTLIFSVVVAVALYAGGEERLANFAIPETLLGILGLSQVVYVAGTLARPASIGDLDEALTKLREMESKLQIAVGRNIDTDNDGKLPAPLPPPPYPLPPLEDRKTNAANAMALYNKLADQVEIMIESALAAEVDRRLLDPVLS